MNILKTTNNQEFMNIQEIMNNKKIQFANKFKSNREKVANTLKTTNNQEVINNQKTLSKHKLESKQDKTLNTWKVQLAHKFEPKRLKDGEWFSLSQKLNGVRGTFYNGKIYSRKGIEITGLEHILKAIKALNLPEIVFDGELIRDNTDNLSDNENFRIGAGIIGSDSIEKHKIRFVIFDMLTNSEFEAGKSSKKYKERLENLKNLKLRDLGLEKLKLKDSRLEKLKLRDLSLSNLKSRNLKLENLKSNNPKIENSKSINLKLENSKLSNLKLKNSDLKLMNAKPKNLNPIKPLEIVPILYSGTNQSKINELLEKVTSEDKEGLILNLNTEYQTKRNYGILKIKKFNTLDLKIKNLEEGSGRLKGKLGAFVIEYRGGEVKVGSGLTDIQRTEFWNLRSKLRGRVVEVKYQAESQDKKTQNFSLQFPSFVRLRETGKAVSYS